jgi:hypothetical protein
MLSAFPDEVGESPEARTDSAAGDFWTIPRIKSEDRLFEAQPLRGLAPQDDGLTQVREYFGFVAGPKVATWRGTARQRRGRLAGQNIARAGGPASDQPMAASGARRSYSKPSGA